jgi:hypothetical protein
VGVLAGDDENHACSSYKQRESEHSDVKDRKPPLALISIDPWPGNARA